MSTLVELRLQQIFKQYFQPGSFNNSPGGSPSSTVGAASLSAPLSARLHSSRGSGPTGGSGGSDQEAGGGGCGGGGANGSYFSDTASGLLKLAPTGSRLWEWLQSGSPHFQAQTSAGMMNAATLNVPLSATQRKGLLELRVLVERTNYQVERTGDASEDSLAKLAMASYLEKTNEVSGNKVSGGGSPLKSSKKTKASTWLSSNRSSQDEEKQRLLIGASKSVHNLLNKELRKLQDSHEWDLLLRIIQIVALWHFAAPELKTVMLFNYVSRCLPTDDVPLVGLTLQTWVVIMQNTEATSATFQQIASELYGKALEWVYHDQSTDRRLSALLIVQHIITHFAVVFVARVDEFFSSVWNVLKDGNLRVRELAAATLESALMYVLDAEKNTADARLIHRNAIEKLAETAINAIASSSISGTSPSTSEPTVHAGYLCITALVSALRTLQEISSDDSASDGDGVEREDIEPPFSLTFRRGGCGSPTRTPEKDGRRRISDDDDTNGPFGQNSLNTSGSNNKLGESTPSRSSSPVPDPLSCTRKPQLTSSPAKVNKAPVSAHLLSGTFPQNSSFGRNATGDPMEYNNELPRNSMDTDTSPTTNMTTGSFSHNFLGDTIRTELEMTVGSSAGDDLGQVGSGGSNISRSFLPNVATMRKFGPFSQMKPLAPSRSLISEKTFMEVCRSLIHTKISSCMRVHVFRLLPVLALYNTDLFVSRRFAQDSLRHIASLARTLQSSQSEMRVLLQTIGEMVRVVGLDSVYAGLIPELILPLIRDSLGGKFRCDTAVGVIACLVESASPDLQAILHRFTVSSIPLIFSTPATIGVAVSVSRICEVIPELGPTIHDRLLQMIAEALTGSTYLGTSSSLPPSQSSLAGNNTIFWNTQRMRSSAQFCSERMADSFAIDMVNQSVVETKLACFRIFKFVNFRWSGVGEFFEAQCSPYFFHPDASLRRECVGASVRMLLADCLPSEQKELGRVEHMGRHHCEVMLRVLTRLLDVAVADPEEDIRYEAITSLCPEVDQFLSSSNYIIDSLFSSTNDESPRNRIAALTILSRIASRNSCVIIPQLRKLLLTTVSELVNWTPVKPIGESIITTLFLLVKGTPAHLHLFIPKLISIVQMLLRRVDTSPAGCATALQLATFLFNESQEQAWGYFGPLIPTVTKHVLQKSEIKTLAGLETLQTIIKSGSGNLPAIANLVPALHSMLLQRPTIPKSVSVSVMRLLGTISAVEPQRPDPFLQPEMNPGAVDTKRYRNVVQPSGFRQAAHEAMRVLIRFLEETGHTDDSFAMAMDASVFVLASQELAQHYHIYVPEVLDSCIHLLGRSSRLREAAFSSLAQIIETTKCVSYPMIPNLIETLRKCWNVHEPYVLASIADVVISLQTVVSEPLRETTHWFVTNFLSAVMNYCESAKAQNVCLKMLSALEALTKFVPDSIVVDLVPSLAQIASSSTTVFVRAKATQILVRTIYTTSADAFVALIVTSCLDIIRVARHDIEDNLPNAKLDSKRTVSSISTPTDGGAGGTFKSFTAALMANSTKSGREGSRRGEDGSTSGMSQQPSGWDQVAIFFRPSSLGRLGMSEEHAKMVPWVSVDELEAVACLCVLASKCHTYFTPFHSHVAQTLHDAYLPVLYVVRFFNSCYRKKGKITLSMTLGNMSVMSSPSPSSFRPRKSGLSNSGVDAPGSVVLSPVTLYSVGRDSEDNGKLVQQQQQFPVVTSPLQFRGAFSSDEPSGRSPPVVSVTDSTINEVTISEGHTKSVPIRGFSKNVSSSSKEPDQSRHSTGHAAAVELRSQKDFLHNQTSQGGVGDFHEENGGAASSSIRHNTAPVDEPSFGDTFNDHNMSQSQRYMGDSSRYGFTRWAPVIKRWASQRLNRETSDWHSWFEQVAMDVLRDSPVDALRACIPLAQKHFSILSDIFPSAFLVFLGDCSQHTIGEVLSEFEIIGYNEELCVPREIVAELARAAHVIFCNRDLLGLSSNIISSKIVLALARQALNIPLAIYHCEKVVMEGDWQSAATLSALYREVHLDHDSRYLRNVPELKETFFNPTPEFLEGIGRYEDAIEKYNAGCFVKLSSTVGLMRCYNAIYDFVSVMRVWNALSESVPRAVEVPQVAEQGALAAHCLSQWDVLSVAASCAPRHPQTMMYFAVNSIVRGQFSQTESLFSVLRERLQDDAAIFHTHSDYRKFSLNMYFQHISELEEGIQTHLSDNSRNSSRVENIGRRSLPPFATVLQRIQTIAYRSVVIPIEKQIENVVSLCELLHSEGWVGKASDTLMSLQNSNPEAPSLKYERLKFLLRSSTTSAELSSVLHEVLSTEQDLNKDALSHTAGYSRETTGSPVFANSSTLFGSSGAQGSPVQVPSTQEIPLSANHWRTQFVLLGVEGQLKLLDIKQWHPNKAHQVPIFIGSNNTPVSVRSESLEYARRCVYPIDDVIDLYQSVERAIEMSPTCEEAWHEFSLLLFDICRAMREAMLDDDDPALKERYIDSCNTVLNAVRQAISTAVLQQQRVRTSAASSSSSGETTQILLGNKRVAASRRLLSHTHLLVKALHISEEMHEVTDVDISSAALPLWCGVSPILCNRAAHNPVIRDGLLRCIKQSVPFLRHCMFHVISNFGCHISQAHLQPSQQQQADDATVDETGGMNSSAQNAWEGIPHVSTPSDPSIPVPQSYQRESAARRSASSSGPPLLVPTMNIEGSLTTASPPDVLVGCDEVSTTSSSALPRKSSMGGGFQQHLLTSSGSVSDHPLRRKSSKLFSTTLGSEALPTSRNFNTTTNSDSNFFNDDMNPIYEEISSISPAHRKIVQECITFSRFCMSYESTLISTTCPLPTPVWHLSHLFASAPSEYISVVEAKKTAVFHSAPSYQSEVLVRLLLSDGSRLKFHKGEVSESDNMCKCGVHRHLLPSSRSGYEMPDSSNSGPTEFPPNMNLISSADEAIKEVCFGGVLESSFSSVMEQLPLSYIRRPTIVPVSPTDFLTQIVPMMLQSGSSVAGQRFGVDRSNMVIPSLYHIVGGDVTSTHYNGLYSGGETGEKTFTEVFNESPEDAGCDLSPPLSNASDEFSGGSRRRGAPVFGNPSHQGSTTGLSSARMQQKPIVLGKPTSGRIKLLQEHRHLTNDTSKLSERMMKGAVDVPSWLRARTNYTKQLAEWSVLQYIFDISCRCAGRFLVDAVTGDVSMFDAGVHCLGSPLPKKYYSLLDTRDPCGMRLTRLMTNALALETPLCGMLGHATDLLHRIFSFRRDITGLILYGLGSVELGVPSIPVKRRTQHFGGSMSGRLLSSGNMSTHSYTSGGNNNNNGNTSSSLFHSPLERNRNAKYEDNEEDDALHSCSGEEDKNPTPTLAFYVLSASKKVNENLPLQVRRAKPFSLEMTTSRAPSPELFYQSQFGSRQSHPRGSDANKSRAGSGEPEVLLAGIAGFSSSNLDGLESMGHLSGATSSTVLPPLPIPPPIRMTVLPSVSQQQQSSTTEMGSSSLLHEQHHLSVIGSRHTSPGPPPISLSPTNTIAAEQQRRSASPQLCGGGLLTSEGTSGASGTAFAVDPFAFSTPRQHHQHHKREYSLNSVGSGGFGGTHGGFDSLEEGTFFSGFVSDVRLTSTIMIQAAVRGWLVRKRMHNEFPEVFMKRHEHVAPGGMKKAGSSTATLAPASPLVAPPLPLRARTVQQRITKLIEKAMLESNMVSEDWACAPHPWDTWAPQW